MCPEEGSHLRPGVRVSRDLNEEGGPPGAGNGTPGLHIKAIGSCPFDTGAESTHL